MRRYETAGCAVAEVLVPARGVDLQKWAVVACDQYTSQPDYWHDVDRFVGDAPSTLRLIFPEVFLNLGEPERRIAAIREAMGRYLDSGVFAPYDGLVYVERDVTPPRHGGARRIRRGLVLCLDLERYDYSKGSTSLIRATEGTIVERIPPRIKIREGAPIESPHIMVLIDDPGDTVIGPVAARKAEHAALYDFDLMKSSGHLTGYGVRDRALEASTIAALERLGDAEVFRAKYGLAADVPVLLYAMGDGNHSLATAKAIWERTKEQAGDPATVMDAPTRYALIELVNVYDEALVFEPIHRVLFEVRQGRDPIDEMGRAFGERLEVSQVASVEAMRARVDALEPGVHRFGVVRPGRIDVVSVTSPETNLAVGTLQGFLDPFVKGGGAREIDYVHGTDTVADLGAKPGNAGFYLPAMSKHELFRSVILDGALPRKTFSMGEAWEKRFYLECRALG
jgi:hypothetical protein